MVQKNRLRILGIDPGSRLTGFGIIDVDLNTNSISHVHHGTLKLASTSGQQTTPLEDRLLSIYEELSAVMKAHAPEIMAIEKVFFAKNAVSALKLGQARGAAILTAKIHSLSIVEYSPTEVKSTICGHGRADKDQVAQMVKVLVGRGDFITSDASDGLALALCHAFMIRGSRLSHKDTISQAKAGKKRNSSLADALAHVIERSKGANEL